MEQLQGGHSGFGVPVSGPARAQVLAVVDDIFALLPEIRVLGRAPVTEGARGLQRRCRLVLSTGWPGCRGEVGLARRLWSGCVGLVGGLE